MSAKRTKRICRNIYLQIVYFGFRETLLPFYGQQRLYFYLFYLIRHVGISPDIHADHTVFRGRRNRLDSHAGRLRVVIKYEPTLAENEKENGDTAGRPEAE